ncbi:MAG: DNA polymerase IV [Chloroflexota bacterium]
MARIILHFDLDSFYCAVEEKFNDDLIGKPFAVGGSADSRGVVSSASYPARLFGVRSAMPMSEARRLCSELIVVPTRHKLYGEWSGRVMTILHDLTPYVEPLSIDEAFLDVTGLSDDGEAIAHQLQMTIRSELELPCSLGVASNKLVAKIANNIGKARKRDGTPPCAIEVVPDGEEAQYLAPLPIRELWGVGPKTAEQMYALSIETIGDIARQNESFMIHHFGKSGYDMWRRAQGIDNRKVNPDSEAKSVSNETTFSRDVRDGEELQRVLRNLAENVGRRLRKKQISGRTINIKLRWDDFTTLTRQTTLAHPTQDDAVIVREALKLFNANWIAGKPVRLIGVGVSNLEEVATQLSLWESTQDKKSRQLQSTLDDLKQKFGDSAIKRGSNLKKNR